MNDYDRHLKVLGLEPGASQDQVREAYRDLVRVWHPDRFEHDPRLKQKAQERLKGFNEAFERLKYYRPIARTGSRASSTQNVANHKSRSTPNPYVRPRSQPRGEAPPRPMNRRATTEGQRTSRSSTWYVIAALVFLFIFIWAKSNKPRRPRAGSDSLPSTALPQSTPRSEFARNMLPTKSGLLTYVDESGAIVITNSPSEASPVPSKNTGEGNEKSQASMGE